MKCESNVECWIQKQKKKREKNTLNEKKSRENNYIKRHRWREMMNENKIAVLNKQGDGKNIKYTVAYSIHKQLYKLHSGGPKPNETNTRAMANTKGKRIFTNKPNNLRYKIYNGQVNKANKNLYYAPSSM